MPRWIPVASLLFALLPALALANQITTTPEPAWVRPIAVPAAGTGSRAGGGEVEARLIDIQVNRTIDPPEVYWHQASAARNELGVPAISQIEVSFNPAYESLRMHRVVIHRGAAQIAVPITGHMKILHRESRLEDQLYDGELTAVLLIEDVRPGDLVESSYTLTGANPVLSGQYASQWAAASVIPIGLMHRRLLWPAARPIRLSVTPPAVAPTITRRGDAIEYELTLRNIAAVDPEPYLPGWYDPFGSVHFADATSWNDVARWATTLFRTPGEFSPALRAKVAEFQAGPAPAMAAIRFVQDDIRYLGIEIGENSHRATEPNVVLARRFGDCKDKALLLVTMLRALGYEADPALVNTDRADSTGSFGPSALTFDHVIVRFRNRSNGETWWVDATAGGQRGTHLSNLALPRFGAALVVSDTTQGLTPIAAENEPALITIEKHIDARDLTAPAILDVKTSYFGASANTMRVRVLAAGREQMEKDFLEFYRRHYPRIESAQDVVVTDDEDLNRIRIEEHYSIPGFWDLDETKAGTRAEFSPVEVYEDLPPWTGGKRTMPLRAPGRHKIIYSSSIDLAILSREPMKEERLETRGLRMLSRETSNDNRLEKYVEIEGLGGYYTPEEALAAVPKFKAMERAASLEIGPAGDDASRAGSSGGSGIDPLGPLLLFMGLGLGMVLAVLVYRAPAPETLWTRTEYAPTSEPWLPGQPIGGWLYLFGFGVLASPFIILLQTVNILSATFPGRVLNANGFPTLHGVLLLEVAFCGVQLAGTVLLIVLFLQRRRKFFRYYLALMGITLVFLFADAILGQMASSDPSKWMATLMPPFRSAASLVIWSSYFTRSRRAEATFVR